VIRAALCPADRDTFDRAYHAARSEVGSSDVPELVESWRGVAVLQSDGTVFARVVRRAAELRTSTPVPVDEPSSVTRAKAGMQLS
jgi:hypothetical protein